MQAAVQKNIDFTEGALRKKLVIFVLPILAGTVLQQLYVTADAVIIGKYTGKIGLAAIDSVYALLRLPVLFFAGISAGASILVSYSYGAKDFKKLDNAVHTAVLFALAGGTVLSAAGILCAPYILHLIAVPSEIYDYALSYVHIYFAGFVFMMLYNIAAGILRALGDSKTPLYILIISCFANVALDILFIGYFKWSTAGAALATSIAQCISAVFALAALICSKTEGRLYPKKLRFHAEAFKRILITGVPIGIQSAFYPIANILIQSGINASGTDNIAAWALCGKLDFLIWFSVGAVADGVSVCAAQNYGAGKIGRVKTGTLFGVAVGTLTVLIISTLLYLYSGTFAKLFISANDYDVIAVTVRIMHFIAPFYVFYVFGDLFSASIRGSGKTFAAMLVSLLTICGSRVVWMLYITATGADFMRIIVCYPLSWFLHSLAFTVYYFLYVREKSK
ncbi:MATE family efflux transporter [Treponema sp. OMZ 840]|uniref:MATE family efflux transporter n=1 Tax=Treponema sp. OMZ 840 TaxID=244313 RepID=UPI003D8D74BA